MLEAVNTDPVFTISLKRSTQNLQLSTTAGRLPHLRPQVRKFAATHYLTSSASKRHCGRIGRVTRFPCNLDRARLVPISASDHGCNGGSSWRGSEARRGRGTQRPRAGTSLRSDQPSTFVIMAWFSPTKLRSALKVAVTPSRIMTPSWILNVSGSRRPCERARAFSHPRAVLR